MSVPPTDPGRMLRAFGAIATNVGYLDNSGAPCRLEFGGDHDCCAICEAFGALLKTLRDCGMDADSIAARTPPA